MASRSLPIRYLESHARSADADVIATLEVLDAQVGRYGLPAELHRLLTPVDVAGTFTRSASRWMIRSGV
jgi:hypothetical protein